MQKYDNELSLFNIINTAYQNCHAITKGDMIQQIRSYLNQYTKIRFISKGGNIFSNLDNVTHVYLVLDGEYSSIRYSPKGQYNVLARRKGLQFLGLIEAINRLKQYEASIIAITDIVVVAIEKDYFVQQMTDDNRVAMFVINNLAHKLYDSLFKADGNIFHNAKDNLIIYLYNTWMETNNNKESIVILSTKEMIANELGINLRTLYRSIKEIKEKNLISTNKGKIIISKQQFEKIRERILELTNISDETKSI